MKKFTSKQILLKQLDMLYDLAVYQTQDTDKLIQDAFIDLVLEYIDDSLTKEDVLEILLTKTKQINKGVMMTSYKTKNKMCLINSTKKENTYQERLYSLCVWLTLWDNLKHNKQANELLDKFNLDIKKDKDKYFLAKCKNTYYLIKYND